MELNGKSRINIVAGDMRRHNHLGVLVNAVFFSFILFTFNVQGKESGSLLSEKINPELLKKTWQAQWIYHPSASGTGYGVFHFRKSFQLANKPKEFIVHVSADNRYRLFVNGSPVCFGPARGDILNWRYETVDLARHLRRGANIVAAVVWNFGEFRPVAQFSIRTAFILQGNSDAESPVNTDRNWKVWHNAAYQPIAVDSTMVEGYYVAGPGDRVDASQYPWGWELPDFDDRIWARAAAIRNPGVPRGLNNYACNSGWNLVPRPIPLMEETQQRFAEVVRTRGIDVEPSFLRGRGSVTIQPNRQVTLLLDQSHLTIGYPELWLSQGKGSQIKIAYAEALIDKQGKKGHRNEVKGKFLKGYYDIFLPDGGSRRLFRPLWYRTYRYVEISIETKDAPLIVHDFYGIFSAYPFSEKATFTTDRPLLKDIWDVGWRTIRLCSTETFADCPYYEQLQYLGDTRIQALISIYVSGDDRLMRNAIQLFDDSRVPEGLTLSRYPTLFPQFHPTFSLIWVAMVHDYYMHRSDKAFTRSFLLGIGNVLSWFEDRIDKTGLLGHLSWPNYMDAAPGFGPAGSPPGSLQGQSAQISLLYAYALDRAAVLFEAHGKDSQARHYRDVSAALKQAVFQQCYDRQRGLFAESPRKQYWTQHTNILAVLTDAIAPGQQQSLMQRVLKEPDLVPAQIYFRFYLTEALYKVGLGDLYLENLQPWETMVAMGLTTFAERALEGRSDCHAWSSSPCYHFLTAVCGIRPAGPGFKSVLIQPHLGPLQEVSASMPHELGLIEVELRRRGSTGLEGQVTLPEGLTGSFRWDDRRLALSAGTQPIAF